MLLHISHPRPLWVQPAWRWNIDNWCCSSCLTGKAYTSTHACKDTLQTMHASSPRISREASISALVRALCSRQIGPWVDQVSHKSIHVLHDSKRQLISRSKFVDPFPVLRLCVYFGPGVLDTLQMTPWFFPSIRGSTSCQTRLVKTEMNHFARYFLIAGPPSWFSCGDDSSTCLLFFTGRSSWHPLHPSLSTPWQSLVCAVK